MILSNIFRIHVKKNVGLYVIKRKSNSEYGFWYLQLFLLNTSQMIFFIYKMYLIANVCYKRDTKPWSKRMGRSETISSLRQNMYSLFKKRYVGTKWEVQCTIMPYCTSIVTWQYKYTKKEWGNNVISLFLSCFTHCDTCNTRNEFFSM